MSIVTAEQVRVYLSSPSWTGEQYASVDANCAQREGELAGWLRVPLTPEERTETVPVLASGLVATSAPIYQLFDIDNVASAGDVPPAGYVLARGYLRRPGATGASARPFSPLAGDSSLAAVTVHYMAGWGPHPALAGAIMTRVGAYALNKHDDTVMARNLDGDTPKPLRENWTEDDFAVLRAFRRPGVTG